MNPDRADSLDGRYFGPLDRSTIIGRAEPVWTAEVMLVESRGHVNALSPKGAIGLMQVMPETYNDMRPLRSGREPVEPTRQRLGGRGVP